MSRSTPTQSYPRLPAPAAMQLIKELAPLDPGRIRERAEPEHPFTSYYATAQRRVPGKDLLGFRDAARLVADAHGFPGQPAGGSTAFDQALVEVVAGLNISPNEAAQEEVWNFISLVTAPDITFWRWPTDIGSPAARTAQLNRWLGRPRNVFRRLWWRAHVLASESASLLVEDEAVSIMERTFRGDRRVARRLAAHHLLQVSRSPDLSRTELLRDVMKRLLRYNAFLVLDAMPDDELEDLFREVFAASERALRAPLPDEVGSMRPSERRSYMRGAGRLLGHRG